MQWRTPNWIPLKQETNIKGQRELMAAMTTQVGRGSSVLHSYFLGGHPKGIWLAIVAVSYTHLTLPTKA